MEVVFVSSGNDQRRNLAGESFYLKEHKVQGVLNDAGKLETMLEPQQRTAWHTACVFLFASDTVGSPRHTHQMHSLHHDSEKTNVASGRKPPESLAGT